MKELTLTIKLFIVFLFIIACGPSGKDYESVKIENKQLKEQLEMCESGELDLIRSIRDNFKEGKLEKAKLDADKFRIQFSKSTNIKEVDSIYTKIVEEEIKLAESTGIWEVAYYVDEFGEPTKSGYIRTKQPVYGTFSNSATENSRLRISFLISKGNDICIKLFEYDGKNPVKSYSFDFYDIYILDNDKERYNLRGYISSDSDRVCLDAENSNKLQKILLAGGEIKFHLEQSGSRTNEYDFTLENVNLYGNAYKELEKTF